jgi:hypothetical protein
MIIPIGYILITIVLLWFMIGAKGWWWLKAICIAGALFFGISLEHSIDSYLGWPSGELVPHKFVVHSVVVKEPSKKNPDDKGKVYVWVTKIPTKMDKEDDKEKEFYDEYVSVLEYSRTGRQPRCYELPYSKPLRDAAAAVNKRIAKGAVVIGQRGKNGGMGTPGGKGDGKGDGKGGKGGNNKGGPGTQSSGKQGEGQGAFSFSQSDQLYFHELPPPRVPEKVNP